MAEAGIRISTIRIDCVTMGKLFYPQCLHMSKRYLPQDFPAHLDPLASTAPLYGSVPLGNHPLKFEDMHAPQFEQFCWWLLQRDHDIEGCQIIGGSGRAQGGIDLFGYAKNDNTQLIVFECKCWESFNSTALGNAIELFLAGPWATPGTKFVLIVAQQSSDLFSRAWHEARKKLRARSLRGRHFFRLRRVTKRRPIDFFAKK